MIFLIDIYVFYENLILKFIILFKYYEVLNL